MASSDSTVPSVLANNHDVGQGHKPLDTSSSSSSGIQVVENQEIEETLPTEDDVEKHEMDEQQKQVDPNIVDFDGPDDPENPLNWSPMKKALNIGIISFITFLSPLASTIIAPGTSDVLRDFHTDSQLLGSFITSVFLIGYIFGPLVLAPLSELYGRAIVYKVCGVIFFVFSIACAEAKSMSALIVFRLISGIGGSCPLTLGAGSIADMASPDQRGRAMSVWILGPLLGPSIGPVSGGYLAPSIGWRWAFWITAIAGGICAVLTILCMHESSPYTILERKTKRLRKETGNMQLRSARDTGKTARQLFAFSIVRPLKMLCFSPIVMLLSLHGSIIYAYLYLLFTTFTRVFSTQYGFSIGSSGLVYLGVGVGELFGLAVCALLSDPVVRKLAKHYGGDPMPEYRLPALCLGSALVPIGLFWYGWAAQAKTHWIVPIIGTGWLGVGLIIVMMGMMTYLVDGFTTYAASANAAATVARSIFAAFLPLAGDSMYNALGIGWGTSLLGFISILFLPVPFLFYIYGKQLRTKTFFNVQF